jgi:hypothetical protein
MDDFPSSVSCVSEIVAEDDIQSPLSPQIPSLYPSLLKVAPEFQKLFPGFRPSSPLYSIKSDGTEVLTIGFVYKEYDVPRFATLVYNLKRRSATSWNAEFNPYVSSPQPHQKNGIDWIKLYHINFEPAFYSLEKILEQFYNLNMNLQRLVAYLINTTPKYFYLLPLHLTLLKRYAPQMKWPVYLATEAPLTDPMLKYIQEKFPEVTILSLTQEQEGFLESRAAAVAALPSSIDYVFPIQEDFLLERSPLTEAIRSALELLELNNSILSVRFMPCPGPSCPETFGYTSWRILQYPQDSYLFTFQATLWRREAYQEYMDTLLGEIKKAFPHPLTPAQRVEIQIRMNVAEVEFGQRLLVKQGGLHLAWPRQGSQPNAVYLSPWPYRPTAVVRGKLEAWAEELAEREGVGLKPSYR